MAVLRVQEFRKLAFDANGEALQVGEAPVIAKQIIDFTGLSGAGAPLPTAFNASTKLIRVDTDAICQIEIGTSPVLTDASIRLSADTIEYFGVMAGDTLRVRTAS